MVQGKSRAGVPAKQYLPMSATVTAGDIPTVNNVCAQDHHSDLVWNHTRWRMILLETKMCMPTLRLSTSHMALLHAALCCWQGSCDSTAKLSGRVRLGQVHHYQC